MAVDKIVIYFNNSLFPIAKIDIDEVTGTVNITGGYWPGIDVFIEPQTVILESDDAWVYLDWDGTLLVAKEFVPYGYSAPGVKNIVADMVAWKEENVWKVKELQ
jgi:hypothetical protein